MNQDWHKTFFSGLWLEFQRNVWPADKTRQETEFLLKILRAAPNSEILDIPCGDGRVSLELARRGYRVTGVDFNSEFINAATQAAQAEELNASFTTGDMAEISWEKSFNAAICVWGSLGYRTRKEDLKFFQAVHRALVPGGVFVLEAATVESLFANFQETGWRQAGDIVALEKRVWRPETSRIECDWTLIKGAVVDKKFSSIRVYTYHELVGMLFDAGFEGVKSYNTIGEESKSFHELSLNFKARKPGA